MEYADEIQDYIAERLKKAIPDQEKYALSSLAVSITEQLIVNSNKKNGPVINVPNTENWKAPLSDFIKMFTEEGPQGRMMTGTIKTVPFFQLSDLATINSLCMVNIQKNPSLDNYPINAEDTETIYTGVWQILGFNHVITANDAYSEFSVVKVSYPTKYEEEVYKIKGETVPMEESMRA